MDGPYGGLPGTCPGGQVEIVMPLSEDQLRVDRGLGRWAQHLSTNLQELVGLCDLIPIKNRIVVETVFHVGGGRFCDKTLCDSVGRSRRLRIDKAHKSFRRPTDLRWRAQCDSYQVKHAGIIKEQA